MTRLHTGTVSRPRFESRPYRPCPARREFIHGPIVGMNDNTRSSRVWFWIQFAVMAVCTAYALDLWVVK